MLKPFQSLEADIADDTTGFVHDYFDLVNVRQENAAAQATGRRTRGRTHAAGSSWKSKTAI